MSRRVALLMATAGMTVVMVALAGMALAAVIACTGGRCEGTNDPDEITGSDLRDRIFALDGQDRVFAGAGEDDLNGGNGGDILSGQTENDTYFGGRGDDDLSELRPFGAVAGGDDEMNGGRNNDFMEGGRGDDVLRGQEASEDASSAPDVIIPTMFGDSGDDELYGGPGNDGLSGDEDTDEHYGGDGNDFIDATEDPAADAPDLVDCGSGVDTAEVLPNDRVRRNCENVIEASTTPVAASGATADEEQQRNREAFRAAQGG